MFDERIVALRDGPSLDWMADARIPPQDPAPVNLPPRQTSALALTSLISGILGWTLVPWIGSLVAIITGHMARGEIRRQPERFDGDGLAIAGLVLGYAMLAVTVVGIVVLVLFFGGLVWLGLSA